MVGVVMSAAANIWSHYLTTANVTLKIAISVNDAYYSGNVLAQGGPELYQQTGATYKGKPVYDTNTAIKLRTGTDINGDAPDIAIELTSNAIKNLLSFKTDDNAIRRPPAASMRCRSSCMKSAMAWASWMRAKAAGSPVTASTTRSCRTGSSSARTRKDSWVVWTALPCSPAACRISVNPASMPTT